MNKTKIEWCDYSWNPVSGCEHACTYCYARAMARRFRGGDFTPRFHPERFSELDVLKRLKHPAVVFLGSNCDLWGSWVPAEWIQKTLDAVVANWQHEFITLTKNPGRYHEFNLPSNLWPGVSLDHGGASSQAPPPDVRARHMLRLDNTQKIVSIEPLFPGSIPFYRQVLPSIRPRCVLVGIQTPVHHATSPLAYELKTLRALQEQVFAGPTRKTFWFYKDAVVRTYSEQSYPGPFTPFPRDLPWHHACSRCANHYTEEAETEADWDGSTEYYEMHQCSCDVFSSVSAHDWTDCRMNCSCFEERLYGVEVCPACRSENIGMTEGQGLPMYYCHACKRAFNEWGDKADV